MFVNDHSFDLMERRRMCCIHFICTEYSTRRDHTDRQFLLFHHAHLDRRCLCTQQDLVVDIEGILLILCRMICRNI